MSTVVPPNGKTETLAMDEHDRGQDRDEGDEQGAGQGDPVQDPGEVPLGLGTGPDAGDEPALLADVVGLLRGVERDGVVEVREADDEQAVQDEVHQFWLLST